MDEDENEEEGDFERRSETDELRFHRKYRRAEAKRLSLELKELSDAMKMLAMTVTELKVKMYFMMKFVTVAGSLVVSVLVGLLIWFFTTGVRIK